MMWLHVGAALVIAFGFGFLMGWIVAMGIGKQRRISAIGSPSDAQPTRSWSLRPGDNHETLGCPGCGWIKGDQEDLSRWRGSRERRKDADVPAAEDSGLLATAKAERVSRADRLTGEIFVTEFGEKFHRVEDCKGLRSRTSPLRSLKECSFCRRY